MDTKTVVAQMVVALILSEPDTEMAKLAVEFAQRPRANDMEEFFTNNPEMMESLKKAAQEYQDNPEIYRAQPSVDDLVSRM